MSIIESIGAYTPEKKVLTTDLIGKIKENPPFFLEEVTGIAQRRYREDYENSFTMALKAAQICLSHSKYEADDLDLIVYSGITRFIDGLQFQLDPPFSLMLKNALGASRAITFDLTNACAGMVTGVHILDNMIRAKAVKRGMVVSGECITHITDTALMEINEVIDQQLASLTVGDAGAAVIIDSSEVVDEGIFYTSMITFADYSDLCFAMPSDRTGWPAMYTDSITFHKKAMERGFYTFKANNILDEFGRLIDYVIPHQTSIRAITQAFDSFRNHFNIPDGAPPYIMINIKDYGNTASTSHFLLLYQKIKSGEIVPGSTCLLASPASGIVIGYIVVTLGALNNF